MMFMHLCSLPVSSRSNRERSAHCMELQAQLRKEPETGRLPADFLFEWVCLLLDPDLMVQGK